MCRSTPTTTPWTPPCAALSRTNFSITQFFPIQAECYLPITQGRDLIGRSKTGTGKTLAFILPLLQRLRAEAFRPGRNEMSVLILEPTRELARQVTDEIRKLSPSTRTATVYGGAAYGPQTDALRGGVDVCVGTPGRLLDLIERGQCSPRGTRVLVLDEADEMLKRGFKREMDEVLASVSKGGAKAQVLLFSATLPPWVREVSDAFQRDALVVDKVTGEENVTPLLIDHSAVAAPRLLSDRLRLIGEMARGVEGRVILFCNRKADADLVCDAQYRADLGVRARAIHGDLSQSARDRIIADFKGGRIKMLVGSIGTHTQGGGGGGVAARMRGFMRVK